MKKSLLNQSAITHQRQTGDAGAFTLTELFVVIGCVALLAAVLLSASFTTQEGVLRAECVANLRQIGTAIILYSGEANGYLPQISWPSGQNPWQTSELARCLPGTSTITRGPMGLGMLWGSKILPNPRVFYCPSLSKAQPQYSYEYYTYVNGIWPSCPPTRADGSPEVQVRSGYMYYAQRKDTEVTRGYLLPKLSWVCPSVANHVVFVSPNPSDPSPQASVDEPCPIRLVDVDPNKVVVVDQLITLASLAHQNNGQPAGANALFPDGHVKFQPVSGNTGLNQAFNQIIWNSAPSGILGNDTPPSTSFRRVVSYFQP